MHQSLVAPLLFVVLALALEASLPCQIGRADQSESPSSIPSLLEVSGRAQQFVSADALGLPQGGTIRIHGIWLRHDGPTATTVGSPHTLSSLVIRVGATDRAPGAIGTVFADNLAKPLRTAFAAANYAVPIDAVDSESVQAWGGTNGELHFPFAAPMDVHVAATGSLVIEFEVQAGATHVAGNTRLDFADVIPLGHLGTSIAEGVSCGYPSANPVVLTEGKYDIGTSFRISGEGFTPAAPVFTWATALLAPATVLPGSLCWSYLDHQTGALVQVNVTDAAGAFGGDPPFPIPPAPGLSGSLLYLQSAALTPASSTNTIGLETSNYRTIKVGSRPSGPLPGWYVARPGSVSEPVASVSQGGFLAIRLR